MSKPPILSEPQRKPIRQRQREQHQHDQCQLQLQLQQQDQHQHQPLSHQVPGIILFQDARIEWIEVIQENPAGALACAVHSHNWFELNFVTKGTVETAFGDNPASFLSYDAGSFFLIPPGLMHAHRYDGQEPHEGSCFRWRIQRNRSVSPAKGQPSAFDQLNRLKHWIPAVYTDRFGIEALHDRLFHLPYAGAASSLTVQAAFMNLLLTLAEAVPVDSASPLLLGNEEDRLLRKVDIYMNDLLEPELDCEQLAASLHMSYGHLARTYKKRTGMTLQQKWNRIRLEKAIEYLMLTKLPIQTIAERAGFSSIYYFSRLFKREYGVSPLRYRLENKVDKQ